jgi:hypothetical protein
MKMPGISLVNRRFPVSFIYEGRDRAAKGTEVSMGEYTSTHNLPTSLVYISSVKNILFVTSINAYKVRKMTLAQLYRANMT